MCKNYLYRRVSTDDRGQEFERQDYIVASCGVGFDVDCVFEEKVSGSIKATDRDEFNKMSQLLQEGDTVYVTETSRLGRNYIECLQVTDYITQELKANIRFISNCLTLEGGKKLNPYQWFTISQLFLADELQRRITRFNTSNALQAKKAKGVKLGRPFDRNIDRAAIVAGREHGMTYDELQKVFGVSRNTISRIMKECSGNA